MKKFLLFIFFTTLVLASCKDKSRADDPLAPTGRTQRTENLLSSLKRIAAQGYMFGHQDSPLYGIGWVGDSARSDVKDVCNDFPAVMGFDLCRIELGDSLNDCGVSFDKMRLRIIEQYDRGGIVTVSWCPHTLPGEDLPEWTDRVADFLQSLETPYGVMVPVLFRLSSDFDAEQWRTVVDRLRERKVTNALYVYSALSSQSPTPNDYLSDYPGDDYIDILGIEAYCDDDVEGFAQELDQWLALVTKIASEKGKPLALTETGYMDIPMKDWWTTVLAPVLDRHQICYALVWRNNNDEPKHCYAPYPGQVSAEDFVGFYNLPKTLFLHDVQGIYLKREEPEAQGKENKETII